VSNQLNNLPSFEQPFMNGKINNKDWFFFFVGIYTGLPPQAENPIVLGVSPFVYTNEVKGTVIISGGTVSDVSFSRNGTTYYTTGQTAGMFPINAQDFLRITYTVAPTTTFVPS
jgi:hypothetical protein